MAKQGRVSRQRNMFELLLEGPDRCYWIWKSRLGTPRRGMSQFWSFIPPINGVWNKHNHHFSLANALWDTWKHQFLVVKVIRPFSLKQTACTHEFKTYELSIADRCNCLACKPSNCSIQISHKASLRRLLCETGHTRVRLPICMMHHGSTQLPYSSNSNPHIWIAITPVLLFITLIQAWMVSSFIILQIGDPWQVDVCQLSLSDTCKSECVVWVSWDLTTEVQIPPSLFQSSTCHHQRD